MDPTFLWSYAVENGGGRVEQVSDEEAESSGETQGNNPDGRGGTKKCSNCRRKKKKVDVRPQVPN
jgi:hypothetical protein